LRADFLNDADRVGRIAKIAIVQAQSYVGMVLIFEDVVDALRSER